ncbi:MAG: DUF2911 domain-containing protein [Maribacter sp.]|uniref:DUF2911 domain-containing protein n=1 Tax=Maribacter sp. 2307UL18-2 TaxID=3386274 RepID=UPI0039BD437D
MKNVFTIALVAIALVFSVEASAQDFAGLDKSPMDAAAFPSSYKVSEKTVRVTYSRPQLKGRSISDLAPAGKVWRTGANEAPEITFYKDVTFGGTAVAAGTYSLFTIPGEGEWTIILNKNLNQWGAYSYDEGADAARVKASASSDGKSLEEFSVTFKEVEGGAHMIMGWGSTRVSVPVMM